jgi:alkylhydroperoxidase family enzyme
MARIPYVAADLGEPRDIVDAIRLRRGGTLLNLDRMLLHSPPFAKGWNAFLGEVRNNLALPAKLRELAMCVVAVLNGAEYEFHHHAPEFLKAGGTQAQVSALADAQRAVRNDNLFNAAERATIRLCIEMCHEVHVCDSSFEAAKSALPDDRQLVELIGVIATYNMVSRFLVALGVSPEIAQDL